MKMPVKYAKMNFNKGTIDNVIHMIRFNKVAIVVQRKRICSKTILQLVKFSPKFLYNRPVSSFIIQLRCTFETLAMG
jgi:hypothetical protein